MMRRNRNVLPLPFIEKLKYDEQRSLSFTNDDMNKKWKFFLYNRDEYMKELRRKQELYKEENLRWKMRLQYVQEKIPTIGKRSIRAGVPLDEIGRVPIPYDLYNFRKYPEIKSLPKIRLKNHTEVKIPKGKLK